MTRLKISSDTPPTLHLYTEFCPLCILGNYNVRPSHFSLQTLEYPVFTTTIFINLFHKYFSLITLSQNVIATFFITFIYISGFKCSYIINSNYFPSERSPATLRSAPSCVWKIFSVFYSKFNLFKWFIYWLSKFNKNISTKFGVNFQVWNILEFAGENS